MTDHYAEAKRLLGNQFNYQDDSIPNLLAALVNATLAAADNVAWAFQLADRAEADETTAQATESALAAEPLVICSKWPGCTQPVGHDGLCGNPAPCKCSHPYTEHAERLDPSAPRGVCLSSCGCLTYEADLETAEQFIP